jgi:hypothetical protein
MPKGHKLLLLLFLHLYQVLYRESVNYKKAMAKSITGSVSMYLPAKVGVNDNPKEITTFYIN